MKEKAVEVRNNLKIVVQLINPIYALYGFLKENVVVRWIEISFSLRRGSKLRENLLMKVT